MNQSTQIFAPDLINMSNAKMIEILVAVEEDIR